MDKFKPGDLVEFKGNYKCGNVFILAAEEGARARVVSINSEFVYLKWDRRGSKHGGQHDGGYNPDNFELVFKPIEGTLCEECIEKAEVKSEDRK